MPGKLATRSSQKKSHNYQILCSHILYCKKSHSSFEWHISYNLRTHWDTIEHMIEHSILRVTSLHWAKITEMTDFVQNLGKETWMVKEHYKKYWYWSTVHTGSCIVWAIGKLRPDTENTRQRPLRHSLGIPLSAPDNKRTYTGSRTSWSSLCGSLLQMLQNNRTYKAFTHGKAASCTRSLLTWGHLFCGSPGTERKAFKQTYIQADTQTNQWTWCSQWLLQRSYVWTVMLQNLQKLQNCNVQSCLLERPDGNTPNILDLVKITWNNWNIL